MEFVIQKLTKDLLESNIHEFIALSKHTIADEYWKEENFLAELDKKWTLSCFITNAQNTLTGFLIASQKKTSVHVHKLVVNENMQRRGLGYKMFTWLQKQTAMPITLKVQKDNKKAVQFYTKNGFTIHQQDTDAYTMIHL